MQNRGQASPRRRLRDGGVCLGCGLLPAIYKNSSKKLELLYYPLLFIGGRRPAALRKGGEAVTVDFSRKVAGAAFLFSRRHGGRADGELTVIVFRCCRIYA